MPEHIYIWIVAVFCGFVGGALCLSLTKLAVDDMWKQASQIATGYAWKYSTGGMGSATWGDVWRHHGGGPDELARTMPWSIAGISLVIMFVLGMACERKNAP